MTEVDTLEIGLVGTPLMLWVEGSNVWDIGLGPHGFDERPYDYSGNSRLPIGLVPARLQGDPVASLGATTAVVSTVTTSVGEYGGKDTRPNYRGDI